MPVTPRWEPPPQPFTWANVAPLGVTRACIRAAVRSGRITRIAQGVYIASNAVAQDPEGLHLQRALAQQMLRPNAIASHNTAAIAWCLDLADGAAAASGRAEFIIPQVPAARSIVRDEFAVAVRELPTHHRVAHPCGLLVTTRARTAVDVASRESLPEALITLDSAARLGLAEAFGESRRRASYTRPAMLDQVCSPLREAMEAAATQSTRRRLRNYVSMVDPRRETALESFSFAQMVMAGLPLPEPQVGIQTPEGIAYPDFLWRAAGVVGEADGMGKYKREQDLPLEKHRQTLLEDMGLRFVRWESTEILRRPAAVMDRIARTLASRGMEWEPRARM